MSLSTNLVAGLASGFDWRSMIDQLIAMEHKRVDLVENQKTDYESNLEIFRSMNTKLLSFKTAAESLADTDAFNVFKTNLSTDSSTYSASELLSVSTSTSASPGNHTITMNASSTVALARQISSKSFSDYDTALSLTGEFVINDRAVEVDTSDTLNDILNKINNVNSGSDATGVTASILTVSSSNYRLVLTSDNTGEDAFTIFDASADAENILSTGLGFTDGTTSVRNSSSNGFQSEAFSSSSQAVGDMLGITSAQSGTIQLGTGANQFSVAVDLSSESLTDIAGNINAAALGSVSASVISSTEDSVTTYTLKIEYTTAYVDDEHTLETLGLIEGDQGSVAEVHVSDTSNTDLASANVTSATAFDEIDTTGGPGTNVGTGDTITISGTKNDGTAASDTSFSIHTGAAYKTLDDLLTQIESVFDLDAGSATIVNGKIQIEDDTAGDSQLSLSLTANNEGGGSLDLGTISASTEGYTMQVQAGEDANITIDGTNITSSTNTINDVIAGVTVNVLTVESGTTVNLSVTRDYDTIKSSVQDLLDQYNDVMADINEQFVYDEDAETAGLLQGDGTLHSIKSDLVDIIVSTITGLPSTANAISLIGITSDNDGNLSIDDDDFRDAFNSDFNALKRIFIAEGSTTDGDVEYVSHTNDTVAGEYPVNITQTATQAQETGSTDLSSGIGAGEIETITISQGSKTAAITLNGDSGENGSTLDDIVNAINSELDAAYAQSIIGNVKNTLSDDTTAITSTTNWDQVYSAGGDAGILDDDEITFTGAKSNGTTVSGSYTISDASSDTVQGLLSAIEEAFDNEVSASINTYGYLVVTDNTSKNSQLSITDIDYTNAHSLDFGDVTTSNLVGSVRNTTGGGAAAIDATTLWNAIDDPLQDGDVIEFSGYTVSGNAVEGSYTASDVSTDTVDGLLTAIETAYNAGGGSVTAEIQDGRIVIKDGTTNSTLGIEILEPSARDLDFGTVSGGVTGRYALSVTASDDGSNHLVLTSDDYGTNESFSISQSRPSSDTNYNQIIYADTTNTTDASDGKIYITSATAWDDIYGAGTIETGDTITISGTDRDGNALTASDYSIDVTTDTVDDLLTAIESSFLGATTSTTVDARIEDGKIVVEDSTAGVSQISLTLAYTDVGGSETGSLALGSIDQSTTRDTDDLGMVDGSHSGLDVQGTINGESATGSGQLLTGDEPGSGETTSVEDLVIKYTGTGTGSQGDVKITMGVAELFDRILYGITNITDGYLDYKIESVADRIDYFEDRIEDMEADLDQKMERMINRFVQMEVLLGRLQSQSSWLAGQINSVSGAWG